MKSCRFSYPLFQVFGKGVRGKTFFLVFVEREPSSKEGSLPAPSLQELHGQQGFLLSLKTYSLFFLEVF
jgi:hypothetical protein